MTTPQLADAPPMHPPSTTLANGTGGNGLTRVTVNLTPRAYTSLTELSESTGLGKTDVINRALQIYSLVEQLTERGGGKLTLTHADGERERIYIL